MKTGLQEQIINLLSDIVLISAILANLVFIVTYVRLVPAWREGPISRTLLAWTILTELLLISILLHELFSPVFRDPPYWVSWVDLTLVSLMIATAIWRTVVLWQVTRGTSGNGDPP